MMLGLTANLFIILFGLIIGSFLTVCIFRIPIGRVEGDEEDSSAAIEKAKALNISFAEPRRSLCPSCGAQLLWWHNIPVVSWLILGGSCAFCKTKIPLRYPMVELFTGLIAFMTFNQFGLTLTGFLIFAFTCALLVITIIDYDYYIIPNVITLPGVLLGVGISVLNWQMGLFAAPVVETVVQSLLGILLGAGFLFLVSEVYFRLRQIEGLGMGDVKLLGMTGAFFGPECALYTIFIGSLVGSVVGIALVLFQGRKMTQHLPFGPYLAFGTFIYIYAGNDLARNVFDVFQGYMAMLF